MDPALSAQSAPLTFPEKLRVLAACVAAVLLLWTVGWKACEPVDPQMGLTLVRGGRAVLGAWPALIVLTVISAALATVIAGPRLPEAGLFAAAVGVGWMSLRGGSMQSVLGYYADASAPTRRTLMAAMAADTVLWTAVLAAAWLASAVVHGWLWTEQPDPTPARPAQPSAESKTRAAWLPLVVTVIVSVLMIWSTIARTPVATIARGQVIASVAAGLYVGALAGRYFTGHSDSRWYVLAAPAVALIAYLLGYLTAEMSWAQGTIYQPYAALATTPPHDLVRALPVEYVAVGVAGAIGGFWSGQKVEHVAANQ